MQRGTWEVKTGLAQMLKGGVIMDVINAEQAKIAQDAGACAVMALERVPADIRATGGVARMDKLTTARRAVLEKAVDKERYVALKVTTPPGTGQAGQVKCSVLYRGAEYGEK